jgi:hypothetical protein
VVNNLPISLCSLRLPELDRGRLHSLEKPYLAVGRRN